MKLTRKQKAFADHLINNPKDSATKAVMATYGKKHTPNLNTAAVIANENLNKPNIQIYLEEHVDKAKQRIVTLVDSKKEEIALRASDSVLNRALGMPTQRTETLSTSVNLNLNLSDVTDTNR